MLFSAVAGLEGMGPAAAAIRDDGPRAGGPLGGMLRLSATVLGAARRGETA